MGDLLTALAGIGQSFWLDFIRRDMLASGELKRLVDKQGITGLTSNPSIFEKAIVGSDDYKDALAELVAAGKSTNEIYESLVIEDIRRAADVLRPIYDKTRGADGFVSLEVSPKLAYETKKTIDEAKRLWGAVDRPNLMIKIPATEEGLPAITEVIASGINVNVTLIFSLSQYEAVWNAFVAGLEARHAAGEPVSGVASVASFFVSRIDSAVDGKLPSGHSLRGKAAVANAKVAFKRHRELVGEQRWLALAGEGARPQRMLWASTSTKNPEYSDVLYVDNLIGPNTVNTLPPETHQAFLNHGRVAETLTADLASATRTMQGLSVASVDFEAVCGDLLTAGVRAFSDSFDKLMAAIETQRASGAPAPSSKKKPDTTDALTALPVADPPSIAERLWQRDPTLWHSDPSHHRIIANRLGWLDVGPLLERLRPELMALSKEAKGFRHALLLGMGGSSLCPDVFRCTFGSRSGSPELIVLDSTVPAAIERATAALNLDETLVIVASKSGSTIEVASLLAHVWSRCPKGEQYIAITDAGSPLAELAASRQFRHCFINPGDIGGRFSALSYFGLVPAAVTGVVVDALIASAQEMISACGPQSTESNPGVELGLAIGESAKLGRDKLTLLLSKEIRSLGWWIEQLVAESTGKDGQGVLPIVDEPVGDPSVYGPGRHFVYLRLADSGDTTLDAQVAAIGAAGFPVTTLTLNSRYDLAAEFFRWEVATAVACSVLGVDAFDEPNVSESKQLTGALLAHYSQHGALPQQTPKLVDGTISVVAPDLPGETGQPEGLLGWLTQHLGRLQDGDYVGILAYLDSSPEVVAELTQLRKTIRDRWHAATSLGFGPRFLHSTGQLHKGGPNSGVFLQITAANEGSLPIPGQTYDFGVLAQAQADGDYQALLKHGRRCMRLTISGTPVEALRRLNRLLSNA